MAKIYFYKFLQLMHKRMGTDRPNQEFPVYFVELFINEEAIGYEKNKKLVNDFYKLDKKIGSKIYNHTENRALTREEAKCFYEIYSLEGFITEYEYNQAATDMCIIDGLKDLGIEANPDNCKYICANIYKELLSKMCEGIDYIDSTLVSYDEDGHKMKEVPLQTIAYTGTGIIIDGKNHELPPELKPGKITKDEKKYLKALIDAYNDVSNKNKYSVENIEKVSSNYSNDFKLQRINYYAALSAERDSRDVFENGEEKFEDLKEEAYQGIINKYNSNYQNGYERLIAVLDKIDSTNLEGAELARISNFIRTKVKRGLCHMLVNDGKIKSWVNNND